MQLSDQEQRTAGWGATETEANQPLPGDGFVLEPASQITRAITIDAPPEKVWLWIVQIGADRGGFYSYDWLENLFGLRIHSADQIVEAWQQIRVDDVVYAIRNHAGGWYVVDVWPNEALILKVADLKSGRPTRRDDPAGWEFLWTFALLDLGDGRTRLLIRERVAFGKRAMRWLLKPVGGVSALMTRRMLLGIKKRAEAHS